MLIGAILAAVGTLVAARELRSEPGEAILFFRGGSLWAVTPEGDRIQELPPACDAIASPDARSFVFRIPDNSSGGCSGGWAIARSDGTRRRKIPAADRGIEWSPGGDRIALGGEGVVVVGADGSNPRVVADRGGDPSWAPDGRRVVFNVDPLTTGIYRASADPNEWAAILRQPNERLGTPAWSPNDERIAFSRVDAHGQTDLYTAGAKGRNRKRLTATAAEDTEPAWSPDGRRIAFASDRSGNWDLFVMAADGTNVRRLTEGGSHDRAPTWSPDGTRIAFRTTRFGDAEIAVLDLADDSVTRLTSERLPTGSPDWSPTDSAIAFGSEEGNIVVIAPDGSDRRVVSTGGGQAPAWSPDGKRIAFVRESVWSIAADGSDRRLIAGALRASAPTWSRTGAVTFAAQEGNDLAIVDTESGARTEVTASPGEERFPSWAPRGNLIAFTRGDAFRVIDLDSGRERTVARRVVTFAWSPDSQILTFEHDQALFQVDGDGGPWRRLTPAGLLAPDAAWALSPTGDRIAFVGTVGPKRVREIHIIVVETGGVSRLTRTRAGEASEQPSWSPDGRFLVYERCRFPTSDTESCEGSDIEVVAATGGRPRRLTRPFPVGASNDAPVWVRGDLKTPPTTPLGRVIRVRPRTVIRARSIESLHVGRTRLVATVKPVRPPCPGMLVVVARPTGEVTTRACHPETAPTLRVGAGYVASYESLCLFVTPLATPVLPHHCPEGEVDRPRFPHVAPRRGWMLGQLAGDADLLAFDEWLITGDTHVVWRLNGRSRVRVRSYAGQAYVAGLAVDEGRIAVLLGDGIEVLTAAGERVARFSRQSSYDSPVFLDDDVLVVEDERAVRVYSVSRAALVSTHKLPPAASVMDVKAGLAVYEVDGAVHLLGLRSGVHAIVAIPEAAPPFAAAFGDRGLFLAHHRIHVRVPGRIGFIPMTQLRAAVSE